MIRISLRLLKIIFLAIVSLYQISIAKEQPVDTLVTGNNNVSIGINNLYQANGGDNNVAVGAGAGAAVTSGYSNTMIGINAGMSISTGPGRPEAAIKKA